jgi:predicted ATPase
VQADLPSMRAHSAALLREARPNSPEAGVAQRIVGTTLWVAGDSVEARHHLERALALFQPGRDDDLAFRFGQDAGVAAMIYLAITLWQLGDVERAVSLIGDAHERLGMLLDMRTRAYGKMHAALFELMRRDFSRTTSNASEFAEVVREYDLTFWRPFSVFLDGWIKSESSEFDQGLKDMRRGVELLREQKVLLFDGLIKIALAQTEVRAGGVDRALAILDEALATCERIGHRTFEAELHRARGETLLKRNPSNPGPAEDALQTAIAVAKKQATHSFRLRAALALAKLYQSAARPAVAHAVLAPALEGFTPTAEMPEIAEAQALLSQLACDRFGQA